MAEDLGQQRPLTRNLHETLSRAEVLAARRKHSVVGLDHLLLALAQDAEAVTMLMACEVDVEALAMDLLRKLGPEAKMISPNAVPPSLDFTVQNLLAHASAAAEAVDQSEIDGANIISAILGGSGSQTTQKILERHGLTYDKAVKVLKQTVKSEKPAQKDDKTRQTEKPASPEQQQAGSPNGKKREAAKPGDGHPPATAKHPQPQPKSPVPGPEVMADRPQGAPDNHKAHTQKSERDQREFVKPVDHPQTAHELSQRRDPSARRVSFPRPEKQGEMQSQHAPQGKTPDQKAVYEDSIIQAEAHPSDYDLTAEFAERPKAPRGPQGGKNPGLVEDGEAHERRGAANGWQGQSAEGPDARQPKGPFLTRSAAKHTILSAQPEKTPLETSTVKQPAPYKTGVRPSDQPADQKIEQQDPQQGDTPGAFNEKPQGEHLSGGMPPPLPEHGVHQPPAMEAPTGAPALGQIAGQSPPADQRPAAEMWEAKEQALPNEVTRSMIPPGGHNVPPYLQDKTGPFHQGQPLNGYTETPMQRGRQPQPPPSITMEELGTTIKRSGEGLSEGAANDLVMENIPKVMAVGKIHYLEVRVARFANAELDFGPDHYGLRAKGEKGPITKAITVRLTGPDGQFLIDSISASTQWSEIHKGVVDEADFSVWRWRVMPRKSGASKLRLDVTVRSASEEGLTAEIPVQPSRTISVKVTRNYLSMLKKLVFWGALFAAGFAMANYGQETVNFIETQIDQLTQIEDE